MDDVARGPGSPPRERGDTQQISLVVNADEFGLHDDVCQGILRAHAEGIVTSASVLVRGAAVQDAVAAAAVHPGLGLGLHLDLAEWRCRDGEWEAAYEVVDTSDAGAVAVELERQLERFAELFGRPPAHLDSHQHVHRQEPVRSLLGRRARELGVPLRHHGRIRYCGAFYGQGHDGTPLPGAVAPRRLSQLVDELGEGATELCCHPAAEVGPGWAYGAERLLELEALCHPAVRAAVRCAGVRLCTFAEAVAELRRVPAPV